MRVLLRSSLVPFVLAAGCLLPAAELLADGPILNGIVPQGGRRGTEVEVVMSGARLEDADGILFYTPGIELKKFTPVNAGSVKALLTLAPDCRLGNHALRVRTASGITEMMLFSVGALPEKTEAEPNNEFTKPQPVELDTTINGNIGNEDVDYYAVTARKGERITAEVEGIRLGRTRFDPYVSIMDKDRFELASSDDAALLWQDGVAALVAPEDGTYVVQVRDSSFGGNGAASYRLHVGRFPRPTAVYPAGGRPGETLEVRFLGDAGGEFRQKIKVPAFTENAFYPFIFAPDSRTTGLFVEQKGGVAPTPNYFRLTDLTNVLEVEPNDESPTATPASEPPATKPVAFNGIIEKPGDSDSFKFTAKKGQQFDIHVYARSIRSPLDSVLVVRRGKGGNIASNDDSGGPDSYLRFTAPADDDYVLNVTDLLKQGGPDYVYRIEVVPLAPKFVMTLPELVRYKDVTVAIPQGNRMAVLVNANWQAFNAGVKFEMKDLPKGVTAEVMPITTGYPSVPVLLTAAADAPLGGSLCDIDGHMIHDTLKAEGHLWQTSMLVAGDNQRPVWTHTAQRMATAVIEDVPFSIEVLEPKVPIVRNGSMELRVRAKRAEGFKAPISIRLLYNPPGIGSSAAGSIAEGQTEGTIPLTANGGASVGTWKIVVLAEATLNPEQTPVKKRRRRGQGGTLVSSQLVNLEIAEAFLQLAFKPAAAELGKEATLVVGVTNNREFPGEAVVELVGLPGEVTAEPIKINKDTSEATFKLKTSLKSPAGRHKAIMCRAIVTLNGEPVQHTLGPAELRIDAPLPPKASKPAPKPTTVAAKPAAVAAKPAAKPLSRLEQLRQERENGKQPTKPAGN
ncbi:MAG TPA: PPC domain-containing protein [Pirellulales bacterium]|jgi:hypothetical protein|nr:PPC domain-containing protein [Pirellulales bacterium]